MKSVFNATTGTDSSITLVERFEEGMLMLPKFQRGYVWTEEQVILLIDSLEKRYPISAITFAQFERDPHSVKVLDGQQRIVSLVLFIAFPFNIDTFFTIIEPKFSISPTTSPTKKC